MSQTSTASSVLSRFSIPVQQPLPADKGKYARMEVVGRSSLKAHFFCYDRADPTSRIDLISSKTFPMEKRAALLAHCDRFNANVRPHVDNPSITFESLATSVLTVLTNPQNTELFGFVIEDRTSRTRPAASDPFTSLSGASFSALS